MNRTVLLLIVVMVLVGTVVYRVRALEQPNREESPIYEVAIPPGYREWQLIAVDNLLVAGKTDQLRAQLGNSIAMKWALHETCFACHGPAKDRDYVFTHYAP